MDSYFGIDENAIEEILMREFRTEQNWTEKMAGQGREEGLAMNEAIYNSHIGNEKFYDKVCEMINEKIRTRQIRKGKDGFADCIEDDKTRLFNMQNTTRITKNILGDVNIEHSNDKQNLE